MTRWLPCIWILLAAGCDVVYGLDGRDDASRIDAPLTDGAQFPTCWSPQDGNEDGDGAVDGCDRCPGIVDLTTVANADGDGVNDACDPSPMLHDFVMFDGFHGDSISADWMADPSWVVADDKYVQPGGAVLSVAELVVPPTAIPSLEAAFDVASGPNGAAAGIGIELDGVEVRCEYRFASGDDLVVLVVNGEDKASTPYNRSSVSRLRLYQDDESRPRCRAIDPLQSSDDLQGQALAAGATVKVELYVKLTGASFFWASLVGRR